MTLTRGYRLTADQGTDRLWFLANLMTVKAGTEQTAGAFTLIDCWCPPGFGPPRHRHEVEDEAFYVLDGRAVVRCGDDEWEAGPSDFVFLPRRIPHDFKVDPSGPLHVLQITSPAQFERFAAELGVPAESATLPERPVILSAETMAAVHHQFHVTVLEQPDGVEEVV